MKRLSRLAVSLAVTALCVLGVGARAPTALQTRGVVVANGMDAEGFMTGRDLLFTSDADKKLEKAAISGDAAKAEEALDEGAHTTTKFGKARRTPLLIAAYKGNLDVVNLLIMAGADVNEVDRFGGTPLIYAITKGYLEVLVTLLISDANPNAPLMWPERQSAERGITTGRQWILDALIGAGLDVDGPGEDVTPLMVAAAAGFEEAVEALLRAGARPKTVDTHGNTALHYASKTIGSGGEITAELLINSGVDVNARGLSSRTPLFWAASFGNTGVVRVLEKAGADKLTEDDDGKTALTLICACEGGEDGATQAARSGKDSRGRCPEGGCENPTAREDIERILTD